MGQTLSTVTSGRFLVPADKQTASITHRLWALLRESDSFRNDAIPDRLALTKPERAMLEVRLQEIDRHLAPARPAAIKRSVGMVKGLMASTAVDGQSAAQVLDGYAMVLAQFPQAVVEDVCMRFLDGRLGNRVYAPTPAEIAHECRKDPDLVEAKAERYRIESVLNAEVYRTPSPQEQSEIQNEFNRLVADMAKGSDARPVTSRPGPSPEEREKAQQILAERRAEVVAETEAAITRESASP